MWGVVVMRLFKEREMNQCLKITFLIGDLKGFLRKYVRDSAVKLGLEGFAHLVSQDKVKIVVCGHRDKIDEFVDVLYNGTAKYKIDNIEMESYLKDRDYRGIFRVVDE